MYIYIYICIINDILSQSDDSRLARERRGINLIDQAPAGAPRPCFNDHENHPIATRYHWLCVFIYIYIYIEEGGGRGKIKLYILIMGYLCT